MTKKIQQKEEIQEIFLSPEETDELVQARIVDLKKKKSIHYEITNSKIERVSKVRTDTGIISQGFDHIDEVQIVINNLDAGDAVALFKVASEGAGRRGGPGLIFILFATITTVIFFIVIYLGYNRYLAPQELPPAIVSPPVGIETPISVPTDAIIDTGTGNIDEVEKERESLEMERLRMQTDFQIESLRIELQKKDLLIESLNSVISEKEAISKVQTDKIIILEKDLDLAYSQINEYEKKDTTRDAFFVELGKKIDQECKRTGSETCKDLYYNFITE